MPINHRYRPSKLAEAVSCQLLDVLEIGKNMAKVHTGMGRIKAHTYKMARRNVLGVETQTSAYITHKEGKLLFSLMSYPTCKWYLK